MVQLISLSKEDLSALIKESVSEILKDSVLLQTDVSEPKFYTRKETAKKLHISLTTLDTYTRFGILNAIKVGHRVLYKADDLNDSLTEKINQIKHKMK